MQKLKTLLTEKEKETSSQAYARLSKDITKKIKQFSAKLKKHAAEQKKSL